MFAQAAYEYVRLLSLYFIEGQYVAEVSCSDFDDYKALPDAIKYDGKVLGKTGWNSDSCKACYKSGVALALRA